MNTNVVERTLIYLQGKLKEDGVADSETQKKAMENKISFVEDSVYLNAIVKAGQTDNVELTDDRVDSEIGVTNLDKGKLPKFGYAAFTTIALRYGGSDTASAAAQAVNRKTKNYNECLYDFAGALRFPAEMLNASFEITDGNDKTIFRKTIREIALNGREAYKNGESLLELKIPRIFKAEEKIRFWIKMPKDVAVPGTVGPDGTGTRHYFQVQIPTIQTIAVV